MSYFFYGSLKIFFKTEINFLQVKLLILFERMLFEVLMVINGFLSHCCSTCKRFFLFFVATILWLQKSGKGDLICLYMGENKNG